MRRVASKRGEKGKKTHKTRPQERKKQKKNNAQKATTPRQHCRKAWRGKFDVRRGGEHRGRTLTESDRGRKGVRNTKDENGQEHAGRRGQRKKGRKGKKRTKPEKRISGEADDSLKSDELREQPKAKDAEIEKNRHTKEGRKEALFGNRSARHRESSQPTRTTDGERGRAGKDVPEPPNGQSEN